MSMIINDETILTRIGELAFAKGITERQLSKKIGKNATYIAILKYERRWPTLQSLQKICDCLEITLARFFVPFEQESELGARLLCKLQDKIGNKDVEKFHDAIGVLDVKTIQTQFRMLHAFAMHYQE